MVGERPEGRSGSRADAARAAQPLGGGHGLPPTTIGGEEVEELGRLGDHRANSFHSMNLACSKFIEHTARLSSGNRELEYHPGYDSMAIEKVKPARSAQQPRVVDV